MNMNKILFLGVIFLISSCVNQQETELTDSSIKSKSDDGNSNIELANFSGTPEIITLPNGFVVEKYNDSCYVYQGDVILTAQQVQEINERATARTNFTTSIIKYWPNRTIYYDFDDSNISLRNLIFSAIEEYTLNTSIKFVRRTNQTDYVYIQMGGNSNDSQVGRVGGRQYIHLASTATSGSLIHEFGHTLGLGHEHCRGDRELYLLINTSNLRNPNNINFKKSNDEFTYIGSLDFSSIMMYPSIITDASMVFNTSIPTITKLDHSTYTHNRSNLSYMDKETIASIYGPPYHKLVSTETYYYEDSGWDYRTERSEISNTIYFYSDENCTQPAILTYPRRIRISYDSEIYTNGQYSPGCYSRDIIVPAGASSYFVGYSGLDMTWDYGIPTGETSSISLVF